MSTTNSFASQVKARGLFLKQNTNASSSSASAKPSSKVYNRSNGKATKIDVKADGDAPSFASQARSRGLYLAPDAKKVVPRSNIMTATARAGGAPSFASQARAKGLSLVPDAKKVTSISNNGAAPSFASQARAKGLSLTPGAKKVTSSSNNGAPTARARGTAYLIGRQSRTIKLSLIQEE